MRAGQVGGIGGSNKRHGVDGAYVKQLAGGDGCPSNLVFVTRVVLRVSCQRIQPGVSVTVFFISRCRS